MGKFSSKATKDLIAAVKRRKAAEVRKALDAKGDPNGKDQLGMTPLHAAVETSNSGVLSLLLAAGGDVNIRDGLRGDAPLHTAASKGVTGVADVLLAEEGVEVNARNKRGYTALYYAARDNNEDMIKLLLEKGADRTLADNNGDTPLHIVCSNGNAELIQFLLLDEADVRVKNGVGRTPYEVTIKNDIQVALNVAVMQLKEKESGITEKPKLRRRRSIRFEDSDDEDDVEQILISREAKSPGDSILRRDTAYVSEQERQEMEVVRKVREQARQKTSAEGMALLEAARKGDLGLVKKYMASGNADVNVRGRLGETPLVLAAGDQPNVAILRMLVDAGADVNLGDGLRDDKPMHHAASHGHVDVVRELVTHGAEVNATNRRGYTPLYVATRENNPDMVELLVELGADHLKADLDGNTPLHVACNIGSTHCIDLLIRDEDDYRVRNKSGQMPHQIAVADECILAVKVRVHEVMEEKRLARERADAQSKKKAEEEKTATAAAPAPSENRAEAEAREKKEKEADQLAARASAQSQGLLEAARKASLPLCKLYIGRGADINFVGKMGETPLNLACGHDKSSVALVEMLLLEGAKVNAPDAARGDTALHVASSFGKRDIAKALLNQGADINVQNKRGYTPLYLAVRENNEWLCELLLARGADRRTADHDGNTPLHVACMEGHPDLIEVLVKDHEDAQVTNKDGQRPEDCTTRTDVQVALRVTVDAMVEKENRDAQHRAEERVKTRPATAIEAKMMRRMSSSMLLSGKKYKKKESAALLEACRKGDLGLVKKYLGSGFADPNVTGRLGEYPLHLAAGESGSKSIVKALLKAGADINIQDGLRGDTALHFAASHGHADIIKVLLQSEGLDPNVQNKRGYTALYYAARDNNAKAAQVLVASGADAKIADHDDNTPLHCACEAGNVDLIDVLVVDEAMADAKNTFGRVPAQMSMRNDVQVAIQVALVSLSEGGAPAASPVAAVKKVKKTKKMAKGKSATMRLSRSKPVVKKKKKKALKRSPSQAELSSRSLVDAVRKEDVDGVKKILAEEEGDPDFLSKLGESPLHIAAGPRGNKTILQLLLVQGDGCVDLPDGMHGDTPLHTASSHGNVDTVKVLLAHDADVNAQSNRGYTALYYAVREKNPAVVRVLLDGGADRHIADHEGNTPLHIASSAGLVDMLPLLVRSPDDLNIKNDAKRTPGQVTIDSKVQLKLAECMRAIGGGSTTTTTAAATAAATATPASAAASSSAATPSKEGRRSSTGPPSSSSSGSSSGSKPKRKMKKSSSKKEMPSYMRSTSSKASRPPPMMRRMSSRTLSGKNKSQSGGLLGACRASEYSLVKKYLNGKADLDVVGALGETPLHLACGEKANKRIVKLLLEHGATIDFKDGLRGDDPLHTAATFGHVDIAEVLVKAGAPVNARNKRGFTPLYYAVRDNNPEMVDFLLRKGADRRVGDKDGNTPLHIACASGHINLLSKLVIEVADAHMENQRGQTPAQVSIRNDVKVAVKMAVMEANGGVPPPEPACEDEQSDEDDGKPKPETDEQRAARRARERAERIAELQREREAKVAAEQAKLDRIERNKRLLAGEDVEEDEPAKPAPVKKKSLYPERKELTSAQASTGLLEAARMGDLALARDFISKPGVDLNVKGQLGDFPLMVATQKGSKAIVKMLIAQGADLRATDGMRGDTALHAAASGGVDDVALLLLRKDGDMVNLRNKRGHTPLYLAAREDNLSMVKLLLHSKADRLVADNDGNTPLHVVASEGHRTVVDALLRDDKDAEVQNKAGKTPVDVACSDDVRAVLTVGVLKIKERKGLVPKGTHAAAEAGQLKDIVEKRASLELSGGGGGGGDGDDAPREYSDAQSSGLLEACRKGNLSLARVYLKTKKADVNFRGRVGEQPLLLACGKHANKALVAELIKEGADPMAKGGADEDTPLHAAARFNQLELVKVLVTFRGTIEATNKAGRTALHEAVRARSVDVVKYLLERGASHRQKDVGLNTPLHSACELNYLELFPILTRSLTDTVAVNADKKTPYEVATEDGRKELDKVTLNL